MAQVGIDSDDLINELLEETHGLRMKYEDFSRFTEEKVAEFVRRTKEITQTLAETRARETWLAQKGDQLIDANDHLTEQRDHLTKERDQLTQQRDQLTQQRDQLTQQRDQLLADLAVLNEQRQQIHLDLVAITKACSDLNIELMSRTRQRDRLRSRNQVIEASRSFRFARRLSRIARVVPRRQRGS